MSAGNWSFLEDDYRRISRQLSVLARDAAARTTLLVDRSGQLIAFSGEEPQFDTNAFASLSAADFAANDHLATLIGEPEFSSLYHQGEKESMYLADIRKRAILVVLFDDRTTLGLVRLRVKQAVKELDLIFGDIFAGLDRTRGGMGGEFTAEVEDEIDNLFRE
ncbi:MAG: roadblock/LC7 domain-containing protein [Gemmatimonadetes bacterium]|nr:roadblock/LC7 domain-containing protein [Gemmatimonadota bacterium]